MICFDLIFRVTHIGTSFLLNKKTKTFFGNNFIIITGVHIIWLGYFLIEPEKFPLNVCFFEDPMVRVHHPCSKNAQLKLIEFFLNFFI